MTDATTLPPEDDNEESAGNLGAPIPPAAPAPAPAASKTAKAPAAPKAAAAAPVAEVIPAAQRVKIILEENDNIPPTGLFIGINGRSYLLRAGEEVDVPVEVIEVLNDAVEDVPYRLIGK